MDPHLIHFDNDDLAVPFRRVAITQGGRLAWSADALPKWLGDLI